MSLNSHLARGFGEPLRLMVDLGDENVVSIFEPTKQKYLLATQCGFGFVVKGKALTSQTKIGKQILNIGKGDSAVYCLPIHKKDTHVAAYASTKRMLAFPLEEVPSLARGKGVRLMNIKGETLDGLCLFNFAEGLGLQGGARKRIFTELDLWIGKRAQVGKLPPHGYQKSLSFYKPESSSEEADQPETETQSDEPTAERVSELISAVARIDESSGDEPDLFQALDSEPTDDK